MHFTKATIIAMAALLSSGYALPSGLDARRSGDACQVQQCCDDADNQCRTAPEANMSKCSADKDTCYTNIGLPSPYGKAKRDAPTKESCDDADNKCRTADDANMSNADKDACYTKAGLPSPYGKAKRQETAVDCKDKECCDQQDNECRTAPDANMSQCSAWKDSCYTSNNLPSPYGKF
ncbi:uncharacterized protein K452DRAFT_362456 [Aplosporella prunicola CBS 121167]|uniref:Uncharacterized protein n=1 Tax=Aplosporella prunicola CBS 121167 TaxID=1176127 RepID=A0A6A6AXN1_9PEZI|nr:uncharacterized protein K452DRAFT_362456 [Aplosporella prunicola CBS 121167]KAF2136520.1 hypothetical protein K452DRAFT_362456 [Aplosporella prunicola CBS 121167]